MKINNQYEEAEAIYPVTGLYIDPDGNAVEKSEMLLSEHRMDVYINDVLTMKLDQGKSTTCFRTLWISK